jgi:hypothetical protein
MKGSVAAQWRKQEGYAGQGLFPKQFMDHVRERSAALAGQSHSLYPSDGRLLYYTFHDKDTLTAQSVTGGCGFLYV